MFSKKHNKPVIKDVIIIGSGIAGSTCAFFLNKKGYNITILEKTSYFGGRILTKKNEPHTIELGARWIHDVDPTHPDSHLIFKLIKLCGIKLDLIRDIVPFQIENKQTKLDITLSSHFAKNKQYRNSIFHEAFCSDMDGFPTAYFNENNIKEEDKSHCDYFVINGYNKLVEGLLKKIDVRYNHSVTKCIYEKKNKLYSILCSNNKRFLSKYVVITCPRNELLNLHLKPSLPKPVQTILNSIPICHLQQAVYTFKNRLWDTHGKWWIDPLCSRPASLLGEKLLFLPYTSQIVYWWWTWKYIPFDSNIIFDRGSFLIQKALSIHKTNFENNILDFKHSNWKESYSGGKNKIRREKLQIPLNNDTLFLAGEHTSIKRYGYVDGAAESGVRVAQILMSCLSAS